MRAYTLINASPGWAIELATRIRQVHGVTSADAITGEYDIIAVCEADDTRSLGDLIVGGIQKQEGVFKTTTYLVIQ
jgi:DNA-binding Lrp family transcriptional regulator